MKTFLLIITLAAFSAGCNDNVKVYHVTQDDATPPTAPPPPAKATTTPTPLDPGTLSQPTRIAAPQIKYSLPDGWGETTPGNMRVASFVVTNSAGSPADVGVIPMPMTGEEFQLVNMWRSQMQLPATTEVEAGKLATTVTVGDSEGKLYDIPSELALIDGKLRARTLVAMSTRGSMSWFFKMVGEESFVEAQKPVFLQFLKSVSFSDLAAPSAMDLSQLPPSHPALPSLTPEPGADPGDKPTWTIPAGWQTAPLTQFLIAKFAITTTDDTKAEINVSALAGEGGGLLANANRWRRQLGLALLTQDDLNKLVSTFDANGNQALLVDFSGTDAKTSKPARLIGVVLPVASQTWFYKLMGDETLVVQQKDAFIKFIQSAKYPDAH
jgi:hypothetical protein